MTRRVIATLAAGLLLAGCSTESSGTPVQPAPSDSPQAEAEVEPTQGPGAFEDAPEIGEVTAVDLDVAAGDVRLRVDPNVEASLRRSVKFERQAPGETHRLTAGTLELSGCGDGCFVTYELVLPEPVPLTGTVSPGHLRVDGAKSVDLTTQSGNVTIADVAGPLDLNASSGNVRLEDLAGPVRVDATAGKLAVGLAKPTDVTVTHEAGPVTVTVPRGTYRVETKVVAGQPIVRVPKSDGSPHVLRVDNTAGNVTIAPAR